MRRSSSALSGALSPGLERSAPCAGGSPHALVRRYSPHAWPPPADLRLALPGVLFLAEFWVGELLVFAAALLPHPAAVLSAFAIYQLTNVRRTLALKPGHRATIP